MMDKTISREIKTCCTMRRLRTFAGACQARAKWRSLQCVPTHATPNASLLSDGTTKFFTLKTLD